MNTIELREAQRRALRLYPNSRGFRSAFVRGARAAHDGQDSSACPYKQEPGKTWRLAWRLAWMRGHASVISDEER